MTRDDSTSTIRSILREADELICRRLKESQMDVLLILAGVTADRKVVLHTNAGRPVALRCWLFGAASSQTARLCRRSRVWIRSSFVAARVDGLHRISVRSLSRGNAAGVSVVEAELSKKVFVVHGHDGEPKEAMARFLQSLGFEPVILHEQPNGGRTIIEKFEKNADVGFAVVLLTPDDVGGNTFKRGRMEELSAHPTVKPLALVVDALKDCSRRRGIVLDPFLGSGTTLLAAEKTGRLGRGIELDPQYVDAARRRGNRQSAAEVDQAAADSPMSALQGLLQQRVDQLGIGLAAGRLHDLADGPAEQRGQDWRRSPP
jgi:hypothetical protein